MSTYVEVFLLIGVALGGSGIVLGAGLNAVSSARGGGVSLEDATVHQGEYAAVESVLVYNTGDVPFSFALSTTGVSPAATYCYTLYDPAGGNELQTSCPGGTTDPAVFDSASAVEPGRGVLLQLTILGAAFSLGTVSRLTVSTSAGAAQSVDVAVLQA